MKLQVRSIIILYDEVRENYDISSFGCHSLNGVEATPVLQFTVGTNNMSARKWGPADLRLFVKFTMLALKKYSIIVIIKIAVYGHNYNLLEHFTNSTLNGL